MNRTLVLLYGVVCYLFFFLTFLYAIGFVGNYYVPTTIDTATETETPMGMAIAINVALLALFAIQHSVMARPQFKEKWTKIVAQPVERSTYVILSSLILILLFWQWRPMLDPVWDVQNDVGFAVLTGLFFCGWLLVLYSTFLIDHFDLFGLRQTVTYFLGKEYGGKPFMTPGPYRFIRHPLYLGWLMAFWMTPRMTAGHLLFSIVTTAYIFVAIVLEERDLTAHFGDLYRSYKARTPMIFPYPKGKPSEGEGDSPSA